MRTKALLFITLCAAAFSGCIHTIEYGRQFDSSHVTYIEKGKTTKQEVLTMFGAPESSSLDSDGQLTMHYAYIKTTGRIKLAAFIPLVGPVVGGSSATNSQKSLTVVLKDGVVANYVYTVDGAPDLPAKPAGK